MPIARAWAVAGAVAAFFGVGLGAFGAHALSDLPAERVANWETGARYQMYHAFGLLAVALAVGRWPTSVARHAGTAFVAGIVLFSGSLYAIALSGVRLFGAVAPIGGAAFLQFDDEQPSLVLADGQDVQRPGVGLQLLADKSVATVVDVVLLP
ncbi:MAG: DUF423 domain-containing protein [Proteobacteria bacterium]|nr:DUF423 domain-containing protein [Pseudomonadota bacterium]